MSCRKRQAGNFCCLCHKYRGWGPSCDHLALYRIGCQRLRAVKLDSLGFWLFICFAARVCEFLQTADKQIRVTAWSCLCAPLFASAGGCRSERSLIQRSQQRCPPFSWLCLLFIWENICRKQTVEILSLLNHETKQYLFTAFPFTFHTYSKVWKQASSWKPVLKFLFKSCRPFTHYFYLLLPSMELSCE